LSKFLEILQNNHSISALVPQTRVDEIPEITEAIEKATKLETKTSSNKGKVLRLRAKAISIKQKQLLLAI
jgi:nitrate reductase NapAB chaperone NapD